MNEILAKAYPARGAAFCRAMLAEVGVHINAAGVDNLPDDGRCVFTCNHPLGGLDGICLITFLEYVYRREPLVVVNDMLMAVEPLKDNFVPINKYGKQSRRYAAALDEALAGGAPVLYFPAGLVSRLQPDGSISDLEWKPSIVNRARQTGRPIVPLYFFGLNSMSFYRFASLRKKSGIKINIEQALLPREMFKSCGRTFEVRVGSMIPHDQLQGGAHASEEILRLRHCTYALAGAADTAITKIL